MDQDPRPGGGRGHEEGQEGKGQDHLPVERALRPARPPEEKPGEPLGEPHFFHGDPDGEDPDEEISHRAGKAGEGLRQGGGRAGEGEEEDDDDPGDPQRHPSVRPQQDGGQGDEEGPVAGHRQAVGGGKGKEERKQRKKRDAEKPILRRDSPHSPILLLGAGVEICGGKADVRSQSGCPLPHVVGADFFPAAAGQIRHHLARAIVARHPAGVTVHDFPIQDAALVDLRPKHPG